jgi:hypothetical protein
MTPTRSPAQVSAALSILLNCSLISLASLVVDVSSDDCCSCQAEVIAIENTPRESSELHFEHMKRIESIPLMSSTRGNSVQENMHFRRKNKCTPARKRCCVLIAAVVTAILFTVALIAYFVLVPYIAKTMFSNSVLILNRAVISSPTQDSFQLTLSGDFDFVCLRRR